MGDGTRTMHSLITMGMFEAKVITLATQVSLFQAS